MRRPREQTMSSLRDKLHWVRCKLHVHRRRPENDYQGKWYRECRDFGPSAACPCFHLAPGSDVRAGSALRRLNDVPAIRSSHSHPISFRPSTPAVVRYLAGQVRPGERADEAATVDDLVL